MIKADQFKGLQKLIHIRKAHKVFGNAPTDIIELNNQHCFGFKRHSSCGQQLTVLSNFSEQPQTINVASIMQSDNTQFHSLIDDNALSLKQSLITLEPYEQRWLLSNH